MKKTGIVLIILFILTACTQKVEITDRPSTFCNPLNLDYGWGNMKLEKKGRHSADPVIVLFKDKYYLFATIDMGGYRVSDDLIHWENIFFEQDIYDKALAGDHYLAPAVAADSNYIYMINYSRKREYPTTHVIRTSDPISGKWQICGEVKRITDPCIFIDNGRFYVYHGLGSDNPTRVFEMDSETFTEIQGTEVRLRDSIKDVTLCKAGYHFGRRELTDEIEAPDWFNRFQWLPCPEGAWIVKNNNKYYLQYATPGTICNWYCDVVMEGDSPTGPFTETPYNPLSLKVGGFISGAGHSCVFQDKYGNWWQITTMWVGTHDPFERRLGLFPVSFDAEGRMTTHTVFGDYPIRMPQRKFDPEKEYTAGWWIQSYKKTCVASSSLDGFGPDNATDENVRTWWSAKTGKPGEWLVMVLGKKVNIRSIQINFAEQDYNADRIEGEDYHAYILYVSEDGKNWKKTIDKSLNKKAVPHDYIEFDKSVEAAYVKIENIHAAEGGKFAIRDMRVFGNGGGSAPNPITDLQVIRNYVDDRFASLSWTQSDQADGYMVHFGYAPDFLNQCIQVKGKDKNNLTLHVLISGQPYYYRVDAYNDSGITKGQQANEHY
ncbi:MAG: family 43 glycosylhydrolase [Dysgonamonadaceae bacterium]|jgi:hypothetical protein|nr:family 43 glycosylhydrolase [Dysgonamonadaceae bacterium]